MMTKCNYGECCFHCSGSLPGYEDVAGACDPCGCKAKMRDLAEVASTAMAGCNARDEVIARMIETGEGLIEAPDGVKVQVIEVDR